jgi:hypothetical protein
MQREIEIQQLLSNGYRCIHMEKLLGNQHWKIRLRKIDQNLDDIRTFVVFNGYPANIPYNPLECLLEITESRLFKVKAIEWDLDRSHVNVTADISLREVVTFVLTPQQFSANEAAIYSRYG